MNYYLITSVIVFLGLGIVWKKSDFINIVIKLNLIALGIIGIIMVLMSYGYIVKDIP